MPFYFALKRSPPSDLERHNRTIAGLQRLRTALRAHFPSDVDRSCTVRIGTWNLREFGGTKHGGRDYEPLYYIAEIISNFDIAAIQEVRGNLREFRELCRILGPDWDYLATDVTDGSSGNGERMVFLYNQRKALFRNIAGELTLPQGSTVLAAFGERLSLGNGCTLRLPDGADLSGEYQAATQKDARGNIKLAKDLEIPLPPGSAIELPDGCALTIVKNEKIERPRAGIAKVDITAPKIAAKQYRVRLPGGTVDDSFKQFARTPYIVSFQAGWLKINLCTVHIYFGDNEDPKLLKQRQDEIAALSKALGKRAEQDLKDDPESRTMSGLLGDFNILSARHETMEALESNGFVVPEALKAIPGTNVAKDKAYDQIAFWKPDLARGHIRLNVLGAGVFDYYEHVYRQGDRAAYMPNGTDRKYKDWRTYKMSDHLPMWIELRTDFGDEYLEALTEAGG
jgi:hypothetical protein